MTDPTATPPPPVLQSKSRWAPILFGKDRVSMGHNTVLMPKDLPPDVKTWIDHVMASDGVFRSDYDREPAHTLAKNGDWTLVGVTCSSRDLSEKPEFNNEINLPAKGGRGCSRSYTVKQFFLTKGPLSEIPAPDMAFYSQFFENEWHGKLIKTQDEGVERSGFEYTLPGKPIAQTLEQNSRTAPAQRDDLFPAAPNMLFQYPRKVGPYLWNLAATHDRHVILTLGPRSPRDGDRGYITSTVAALSDVQRPSVIHHSVKTAPPPDLGSVPSVVDASGNPIDVRKCAQRPELPILKEPGPTTQTSAGAEHAAHPAHELKLDDKAATPVVNAPVANTSAPDTTHAPHAPASGSSTAPSSHPGNNETTANKPAGNAGTKTLLSISLLTAAGLIATHKSDKPSKTPGANTSTTSGFKWSSVALCTAIGVGLLLYTSRGAKTPDQSWGEWFKNSPTQSLLR